MSLVEDKEVAFQGCRVADADTAMAKWQHFPASALSHHMQACCDVAREWVLAMDYTQLSAGNPLTGPRWLRQRYTWGPSPWPLYWCEAIKRKTLDCGALASLSHEVFTARGVKSYPVQLIQEYSTDATTQWHTRWNSDEISAHWIEENLIYHEGCAVRLDEKQIRVWDASAGWWINPKQFEGYGSLLVLRVITQQGADALDTFQWGEHQLSPNRWETIARERGGFA